MNERQENHKRNLQQMKLKSISIPLNSKKNFKRIIRPNRHQEDN